MINILYLFLLDMLSQMKRIDQCVTGIWTNVLLSREKVEQAKQVSQVSVVSTSLMIV